MKTPFHRLKKMAHRLTLFDWGLWFGGGIFCLVEAIRTSNGMMGALALLLLTPGIAQFTGHRWAWHAGIGSFSICGVWLAYMRLQKPFTILTGALIVVSIWAIWQHWTERATIAELLRESNEAISDGDDADGDEPPENSLVLWLKGPRFLDAGILSRHAEQAFGVSFGESEDADGFVVGKENHYILKLGECWFIIHYRESNYFEEPEAVAKEMKELRRANIVRQHEAWLSVDYLRGPDNANSDEIMGKIRSMVSELASADDVLALYHPNTRRIAPWSDEVKSMITSRSTEDIFEIKAYVPVIRVEGDSEKMAAAVAEARRHWPEFVAAFHASVERDGFSVKAPVTEAGNTEFIWISVRAISDGQIHGFLANDPVALGTLKIGAFVSVSEADMNDWCYPSAEKADRPRGLFTLSAFR
ncbi:MAG: DUF2314 domain-containing protein [Opitutaceae bacterium]|jgi:uncharacterized protein YegJ (DUF2314 family)